jgi:rhamnogalacturonan endolyase
VFTAGVERVFGAFGVTSSGGYYTVDTGGGLVFKVRQTNGDITSLNFNGIEYQSNSKKSQIASGLGSATVTADIYGSDYIKLTITTASTNTVVSNLTHYLMVRNGDPVIYMATYVTAEPAVGELRWITRLQWNKVPNGPPEANNNGTTGAIESTDVFGYADGQTTSKYYGRHRAMELTYTGATGNNIGVWMVFDTRESSSGGPFYRDIENQGDGTNSDQEVYNYMNSGHQEPEAWRLGGLLYGPYALVFTTGDPPALPVDYSWIETGGLNLLGWVSAINRGAVTGFAWGIPAGFQGVVRFANTNAQYWAVVSPTGTYQTPLMKPGTYTATLYKGELPVTNSTVTVSAGATNTLNLVSGEPAPSYIFKIGEWDGTPAGFLNAGNIINMHPQDVRNASWGPVTHVVGSNSDGDFPAIQMRRTNSPTTILFNLDADQITTLTLRLGMTCTYNNGRPQITINGFTRPYPGISSQPNSRSFTVGTWRGNDTNETYSIPAGDLVVGQNTLTITPVSGSSDLGPWLSAGWVYDAVELDIPDTGPTPPAAPDALTATAAGASEIDLAWADNSTNEINFLIERSLDNETFTLFAALPAGTTNLADTGLSSGSTCYYRVRASNGGGNSDYSDVAGATTIRPPPQLPVIPMGVYNVTNYGAVGNGVKDNTTNIQKTINAASAAGGGTVVVPQGIYLSGPFALASSINLRLDGGAILRMLPSSLYPGGMTNPPDFISGAGLHDIEISGPGSVDGQGAPWWRGYLTNARPVMVALSACRRVLIQDTSFSNSPMQHLSIKGQAGDVTLQRLTIAAPSSSAPVNPSHNTDGIDLAETNCLIQNCNISVGDDNIALGSGSADTPTAGVVVTNCAFGDGRGLSIGSNTAGGVLNVTVVNCTFNGTANGIRIKSDNDRGGVVQNLSYLNLGMTNVQMPIVIYGYGNEVEVTNSVSPAYAAAQPVAPVTGQTPIYRNITISNLTATTASGCAAGVIWGRTEMPVTNIVLNHVNITATRTFDVYNARRIRFVDSHINVPSAKILTVYNAGITMTNSVSGAGMMTLDGTNSVNTLALCRAQAAMTASNALGTSPITLSASTLTVSNDLTLPGSSVVNFTLGTNLSQVLVTGNLALGSTLNVTNGGGFGPGSYTLFSYGGSLSGTPVLGSVPAGYAYIGLNTNTPGQVRLLVSTVSPATNVTMNLTSLGGNLVMSGTGGTASGTYYVLTSTNLALPLAQWARIATNQFDGSGHYSFTNSIPANPPWAFYLLQLP